MERWLARRVSGKLESTRGTRRGEYSRNRRREKSREERDRRGRNNGGYVLPVERLNKEAFSFKVLPVYHLSAQFPGPTTPRDFVTLLLTSSSALTSASSASASTISNLKDNLPEFTEYPRHFMVISKPCKHPDCPPRDGFIRGEYESIEFVREIPQTPQKVSSTTDLPRYRRLSDASPSIEKEAILRHARQQSADYIAIEGRTRGKTISFAESRDSKAKDESVDRNKDAEDDVHPVEWIMITRSDPGGSVPRFMVERGTPSGIVSDAGKFIDWACKRGTHSETPNAEENADEATELKVTEPPITSRTGLETVNKNGQSTGLDGVAHDYEPSLQPTIPTQTPSSAQGNGIFASLANSAYSSFEAYAPQAVIDRFPVHASEQSSSITLKAQSDDRSIADPLIPTQEPPALSPVSSTTSIASFASADSHLSSPPASLTSSPKVASHERELAKLAARKQHIDAKFLKTREKETKNKEELTSKEAERLRKAEEKHAREIRKAEEKHEKEVQALEAKRKREESKSEEKMKRALDKDEKARLTREKEELRLELEMTKREKDILREQVGELQKENTGLVVRLGKLEGGGKILKEVKDDLSSGSRSRSSSLRRNRGDGSTITVGEVLGGAVGAAVLVGGPKITKSEH